MDEFKIILLNDDFTIAYYSKKKTRDYATLKCKIKKEYPSDEEIKAFIDSINDFYANKIDKNINYKIKLDTALHLLPGAPVKNISLLSSYINFFLC